MNEEAVKKEVRGAIVSGTEGLKPVAVRLANTLARLRILIEKLEGVRAW